MTKRFFTLLIAIIMLFSACNLGVIVSLAATVETDAIIRVDKAYGKNGSTVSVDISIENNPGILGMTLTLEYDESILTLTDIKNGEAFNDMTFTIPRDLSSGCKLPWDAEAVDPDNIKDGVIATLIFDIAEDASIETFADISVSYKMGAIIDEDMNSLKTQIFNGYIHVIDYTPGDVNGDGYINSTDVVYLRRYIAGGYGVTISEKAADVNDDGEIDTTDVVIIRRYVAGGYNVKLLPFSGRCNHERTHVPFKEPTTESEGNKEYWYCEICEKCFTSPDGTDEIAIENTIIPIVNPDHHNVYYYDANGTCIEVESFSAKTGLSSLFIPELKGYNFIGWYTAPNGGGDFYDHIEPGTKKDIRLYAYCEIISYTIYFYNAPENGNATETGNTATYTVEDRILLSEPKWSGLKFLKWTDSSGRTVTDIPKGSTGDIELTANWQLLENTAVPSENINELWTDYDEKNGHNIFVYDMGEIQHVVLEELDRKYKYYGQSVTWEENKTVSLDNGVSNEVSKTVSDSVTKTTQYEVTDNWTETNSSTFEKGLHLNLDITFIKDVLGMEIGGELNWSDTNEESWSHTTTNSEGFESSIENTHSNTSTVSYNNTVSKSFTTSATIGENMPEGEYRYVYYGTVRVFAVVVYEPLSGNYRLDTYSVLSEDIGSMPLYVPPVGTTANIKTSDGLPCNFPLERLEDFMEASYYIEYDGNGGSGSMYSKYYPTNLEHTLSENKFTKPGYKWIGWNIAGYENTIKKDVLVSNLGNSGQLLTAVAQWAKNSYTIAYDGNKPLNASSSVLDIPQNISCVYDEDVILGKAPSLVGWTFEGWYRDPECKVRVGDAEQTITAANLTTSPNETVALFANWIPNTYTITYDANGGKGTMGQTTHTYDTPSALRANSFSKTDHVFIGWSTDPAAKDADFTDQLEISSLAPTGNVTLYAVWLQTKTSVGYYSREIRINKNDYHTDEFDLSLDKDGLIAAGYKYLKMDIKLDAMATAWIVYNGAEVFINSNNADIGHLIYGTFYDTSWFGDGWHSKTMTAYIDLTKMSADCDFNLKWHAQNDIGGSGDGFFLGNVTVNIQAVKNR